MYVKRAWPPPASAAGSFVRNTQQTYLGGANAVDAKYLASYGTQVVPPRLLSASAAICRPINAYLFPPVCARS